MKVKDVELTAIHGDLGDVKVSNTCSFCQKSSLMTLSAVKICEKLSPDKFFCRFCIRNNLTTKSNRHVLMLTFRAVFGYFYYAYYRSKKKSMFLAQIEEFVQIHEKVGLSNPAFRYDPESFIWFIDFEKVGDVKRKVPVAEVHKTVLSILSCFNFYETVPNFRLHSFYKKYQEAIDLWYTQRSRPEGRRLCSPTFQLCGVTESKELPYEKTREFLPSLMLPDSK